MRAERTLAIEAAALLVLVRVSFRLTSFATTRRLLARGWSDHGARVDRAAARATAVRVRAAVHAAARRVGGATCLAQALTAESMLRRLGVPSTLHIGVRPPSPATPFDAHAWLECAGAVVVGDQADLAAYRVLARSS